MVISVLERRSEIGLRRALGATKRHIWAQFVSESLILASLGGLAGVVGGALVTVAYASTRDWDSTVPPYGLAGGIGGRGPGETKLETDRRRVRDRIAQLERQVEGLRRQRYERRKNRAQKNLPVISLVGYTNAGKSSLLNALTHARAYVADALFATLDPTTRKVELPGGYQALFTDTVGFIQKLPTTLVESFHATLEEIVEERVVRKFDHMNLDTDVAEFRDRNSSVENIARACFDLLREPLSAAGARLMHVRVWETEKTSCTYPARLEPRVS